MYAKKHICYNLYQGLNWSGGMKLSSRGPGRPAGKKKTSKLEVSLEPELKSEFMSLLKEENKYCSIVIREWIVNYIIENKK